MKKTLLALSLAVLWVGTVSAADPAKINWDKIKPTTVALFFPGQSTYEWLRSDEHKGAGKETARGDACVTCHDSKGVEKRMGEKIVKGGRLEPTPIPGKSGYKDLKVQAAYDDQNAYLRFQWKTDNPYPGNEHQYLRFDGKEWKVWGFPKLDKVVHDGNQPGIYEDRMSIMIDDGKVAGYAEQGCWLTCHDGQRDNPKQFTKEEAAENALLKAIKKNDVRKYLPDSRTDPSDWKTGKSMEDIAKLKAEGKFVDLIQWRAHRSNPVGMTDDGYVLEFRNSDAGKDPWSGNADAKTHQPKFMWDEKKVGYKSIRALDLRKGDHFLLRDTNAVAFDPNAGWKEGDMLPDYTVGKSDVKGSTGDNGGIGQWKDGMWTVVMIRPLGLTNDDDKTLKVGGVYNIGFGMHDDNITTRGHQVSFNKTLGFGVGKGTKVDINAVKLP
ncbi:MAG: ethylbenzene dehydrogenase-related protein [Rhodoferax sp.]|uniref:ethylbenzene dehydrogenase-related protein n=1 Tax=Rhodoferax sp. TaxID=50421 RepID=UPI002615E53C|nr:ethylbenzene dehydrogenase-related protein [Rhodoferax sp.]MDD2883102.1 ethylbenzene dehydrogenase-related protein [Rhodoferax sp.]